MITDEWSKLTFRLRLPDAARQPIENELDIYRRFAQSAASPPSETRKKLEYAASAVGKVLELIEGFGPDEHSAFVEREGPTPRLDAFNFLIKQHADLTALRDRIGTAARKLRRGKTGSDASNARALVRRVSEIVETYIGTPLNKGKPELDFAKKLGELADPKVKFHSIKGAIENLR